MNVITLKTSRFGLSWSLLILLALIWGSSFVLIRKGLDSFSTFEVADLRISSAFLVVFLPALLHFRRVPPKKLPYVFLSGLLGNLIPAFLFAKAQTELLSSATGILNSLTPLFTFVIGVLFFQQKPSIAKFFGVLLGITGICLIFISKGTLAFNYFAFYAIGGTICYALNIHLTRRYLTTVSSWHLTSISLSLIGIIGTAHLFTFTDFSTQIQKLDSNTAYSLAALVFLGVVNTAICSVIFYRLLQISSPTFASSVTYLIPIVATLWGLLRQEPITIWYFGGLLTIITGVWIMNTSK